MSAKNLKALLVTFITLLVLTTIKYVWYDHSRLGNWISYPWLLIVAIYIGCIFIILQETKDISDKNTSVGNALWNRYTGRNFDKNIDYTTEELRNAEPLIQMMDRAIDRQINKAIGILPMNAILTVFLTIDSFKVDEVSQILLILGLIVSSGFCLSMFFVVWDNPDQYSSTSKDFVSTLKLARKRSIHITVSAYLSLCCLIGTGILIIAKELSSLMLRT